MQQHFKESNELLRTKKSHMLHVQTALSNNENEVGVNRGTILDELEHFNSIENYTPDVMHDILEGICPYELKLVLHHFIISQGLFTLDSLNDRIRSFNYGRGETSSKPVQISKKSIHSKEGTIKQSASKMWCLFRNLPLMIGDLIPEDNPHWELILSLLNIMSVLFAQAITREATYMLEYMISDHLQLFKQLFPNEKINPKQHYLLHYPRCIRMVGPLVKFWAMRFEAKHNFFRRLSHIVCNFKNICKTMAYRHQYAQCYRFYMNKDINESAVEVGTGRTMLLINDKDGAKISAAHGSIGMYEDVFIANWIKVHSITYRPGVFLLLSVDSNDALPYFGELVSIAVSKGKTILTLEEWNTKYFHPHLNAYAVEHMVPRKIHCVEPHKLIDFHPVYLKNSYNVSNSDAYVVMHHKPWY